MKSCIQMVGLLQSRDSPHLSLSPPSDGDTRSSPMMSPVTSATTSSNTSPAFLLLYFELLPFYIYFRCYEVRSPTLKRHPPSHELRSSITCFVPPCNNKTKQTKQPGYSLSDSRHESPQSLTHPKTTSSSASNASQCSRPSVKNALKASAECFAIVISSILNEGLPAPHNLRTRRSHTSTNSVHLQSTLNQLELYIWQNMFTNLKTSTKYDI